ncbi:MAG: type 4a pilus biogenesis protein PilO [bacterium]
MAALLERRVLLIAAAVCILLAVFAWFVLYQPQMSSSRRSSAQAAELRKEIDETKARISGIGRLRARVVELEEANAAFAARVMPRSEMLGMLQQLASIAQLHRVRFLEIAPPGLDTLLEEETSAKPVRGVPFYLTLQGRFIDIGRYIESLDRFPYFVRVPDFEVTAREDIRPEVEVKLLVNFYTSSLTGPGGEI